MLIISGLSSRNSCVYFFLFDIFCTFVASTKNIHMKLSHFIARLRAIFSFLFIVVCLNGFGQVLLQYPLNSNFTPNIGPAAGMNPQLKYFDPPNEIPLNNINFSGNNMNFSNNGDYLELTFDATNYENLSVEFTSRLWALWASANIKIYLKVGSNNEILLEDRSFSTFLFANTQNFSQGLIGANNQSNVRIRIVGSVGSFLNWDSFGINNLRIIANTTTMSVRSDAAGFPIIPHEATASHTLDTDFGDFLTEEGSLTKRYRITNTGNRVLNISNFEILPNDQDFEFVGTLPTSVPVGQSRTFDVRFAPHSQGLKLADVLITSNSVPHNPFKFQVVGRGKSCNTEPIPIFTQHFEEATQNLPYNVINGNFRVVNGTSNSHTPSSIPQLYPSGNLYMPGATSGTHGTSWYVNGTETNEVVLEFGPVDISDQQDVRVNFNVAAFGATNNNNSGVLQSDYVILSVFNPITNTYVDEIRLNGSNNNSTRRKYGFGTGQIVTYPYNNTLKSNSNNNSANYSGFILTIPNTYGASELKFRITARTGRSSILFQNYNYNYWMIDNVHVSAGNAIIKTWNGSQWSGAGNLRPSSREKIVFNGVYDFSGAENQDLEVCECEIRSGRNVTIPANRTLTVRNQIINQGNGENFVIKTDGNLIQREDNATNSGSLKAEKHVTGMDVDLQNQMDYVYWSSPVNGQKLRGTESEGGFSPGTPSNRFFELNEVTNFFVSTPDTEFLNAKGYSIRAENGLGNPYNKTYVFKGTPNNGVINSPLLSHTNEGYNLVGNPYPSNINADDLFALNNGKIFNTVLFWENKGYTQYQQGSNYSGNNYVVYNGGTGGVPPTEYEINYEVTVNSTIKLGQGFLVKAKPEGHGLPLVFDNSLRTSSAGEFYQKYEKDRYWLTIGSPSGTYNTMLVGYILGATNDFEDDFDVNAIYDDSSDLMYSVLDENRMVIQGREFPLETSDVVPLGVNLYESGIYTIYLRHAEGIFREDKNIYINDKQKGKIHNLTEDGVFYFESLDGRFEDRFEIVYKIGEEDDDEEIMNISEHHNPSIDIYKQSGFIVIKSEKEKIVSVEIYNLAGISVYNNRNINDTMLRISDIHLKNQIVIVRVQDEFGRIVTKKMIIK